jgi:hypothetical protein
MVEELDLSSRSKYNLKESENLIIYVIRGKKGSPRRHGFDRVASTDTSKAGMCYSSGIRRLF